MSAEAMRSKCIEEVQRLFDGEQELAKLAHLHQRYDDEQRHKANAYCFHEAISAIRSIKSATVLSRGEG